MNLKSRNPFRCIYVYIERVEEIGRILKRNGVKGKILDVYVSQSGCTLAMVIIRLRKADETQFINAMRDHKRNSVLFGWGATEECSMITNDLHSASKEYFFLKLQHFITFSPIYKCKEKQRNGGVPYAKRKDVSKNRNCYDKG